MRKILFLGNFLSKSRGTKGIAERIAVRNKEFQGFKFYLASCHEYKLVRLLDIISAVAFRKYELVIMDVYSGTYFLVVRIATIIAKFRGKRIVLNLHGGKLHEHEQSNLVRFAKVMSRASKIITPSLFLQQKLRRNNRPIEYLPNFIEIDKFPYVFRSSTQNLLWVRAFSSIYNPALAIHVLAEVRKQNANATLTMVGPDRGELNACRQLIKQLELTDAVTVTGRIDNQKLVQYYHSHGVFLNTPSYESFGLAVLEAASCGIPIVSNRVGEIPFLWEHEKDMLLTEPGNVGQMAEAVLRLFDNPVEAQQYSLRARQKAERFSWLQVKTKWVNLISIGI